MMNKTSNYDKYPATKLKGEIWTGWASILKHLSTLLQKQKSKVCVIECYHGVLLDDLIQQLKSSYPTQVIDARDYYKPEEEIRTITQRFVTDDRIFGYKCPYTFADFIDPTKKLEETDELTIICGPGAYTLTKACDLLVYADMARWEIQQRFRKHEIDGLGIHNREEGASYHYKRSYFVDWDVCDQLKKQLIPKVDFWLDTNERETPKMITGETCLQGLEQTAQQPFRVVPFFDPAPWGGQWMKRICDLDQNESNFGWCFDCVPEENSLYLSIQDILFELPSNNVVYHQSRALLGDPVVSRFGKEFPIRFDFLDTMGGGNLSLQVHPTTQYIQDTFGLHYTQDESYYMLDADENATVYLALKKGVDKNAMIADLHHAQETGKDFEAEKYVNRWAAKKHDHFLIPNGTIHCSGSGGMVLEISTTPSIFTFKLFDWGRLGLDGIPRPINIGHGEQVIQWERDTDFARRELVDQVTPIAAGDGWREERTGLHTNEFLETRRHWFTKTTYHHTGGGVNVLNLVEGREAIVESPSEAFPAFVVHYAETFIIPACVGEYTIRPYGESIGSECATIKAYIRFKA